MNESEKNELLTNWQFLMLASIAFNPLMYLTSDLYYVRPENWAICLIWRVGIFTASCAGLVARFARPDMLLRHWRVATRIIAFGFYTLFIWVDYQAEDSGASSYYFGIILVGGGTLAFRVYKEAIANIAIATILYTLINFEKPSTYHAVADVFMATLIYFLVTKSYMRVIKSRTSLIETIHHDWKVPLLALAEFGLELRTHLPKSKVGMAKLIEYNSRFLFAQAEEMVDQSDISQGSKGRGPSDLRSHFTSASETAENVFKSKIVHRNKAPTHNIGIDGHEAFRIFLNLLANAITYSPDRRVRVQWLAEEDRCIKGIFSNRLEENSQVKSINLERLFEKNFSLGSTGRGIGLYSARRIAEEIGGSLQAEIRDNEMTFILELPGTPAPEPS